MVIDFESLKQKSITLKADRAAVTDVSKFVCRKELRDMCASNVCGKYGTNWACPPAIGELEELEKKISSYTKALVIQTVYQLEDSFDFEGMLEAKRVHKVIFEEIAEAVSEEVRQIDAETDMLYLSAGGCDYCEKCAYVEQKPCRFPDKLIAPIEGYGIDVTALANTCGLPYNNGSCTVSYMSAILFKV